MLRYPRGWKRERHGKYKYLGLGVVLGMLLVLFLNFVSTSYAGYHGPKLPRQDDLFRVKPTSLRRGDVHVSGYSASLLGSGSSAGQSADQTSDAAAPALPPGAVKSETYLWFEPCLGNTNNQLISYNAAFRLAKGLGRTVFIPAPIDNQQFISFDLADDYYFSPWNLTELRSYFSFVTQREIEKKWKKVADHPILGNPEHICKVPGQPHMQAWIAGAVEKAKDVRCKVVYVESQGSWIDGDTAEYGVGPYEFWSRIDVKDWMKEIIHKFLGARNWQRPIVSLHIRTFLEEEVIRKGYELCSSFSKRKINKWRAGLRQGEDDILLSLCHPSPQDLLAATHFYGMESFTIGRDHAFFMTTDREYKEVDDALMEAGGVQFELDEKKLPADFYASWDRFKATKDGLYKGSLDRVTGQFGVARLLLDMFLHKEVDFFMGAPQSTMLNSVCLMRGKRRVDESNVCAHYTDPANIWVKW